MAVNSVVDGPLQRSRSSRLGRELRREHADLRARLAVIMGSASLLEAIAESSYWHPNGFAKLVLDQRRFVGEVRLHIWPRHPHDEDIHGHSWTYRSTVLAGELTEVAYRECGPGEGDPMWRHSYRRVKGRQFAFGSASPVHLAAVGGEAEHGVGAVSGGTRHHVHRFYASVTPAVTLLRVAPSATWTSSVYRPTPEPPPVTTPQPTTIGDVRDWLGFVADLVDH